jgi:hypothetical protein
MKKGSYERDPITYRIAYSRITHLLHLETKDKRRRRPSKRVRNLVADLLQADPSRPDEDVARAALVDSLALLGNVRRELDELGWRWVGWPPSKFKLRRRFVSNEVRRLGRFLDQVLEPCTVILYFAARTEMAGPDESLLPPRESNRLLDRREVKFEPEKPAPSKETETWLHSYFDYLVTPPLQATQGFPGRFEWSARIGWKQAKRVKPRVRYNLACLYSRLGDQFDAEGKEESAGRAFVCGFDQLRRSIAEAKEPECAVLAKWAPLDPAFEPLKRFSKPRFEEALAGALTSGVI